MLAYPFADAKQYAPIAAGMLPRYQPHPGSQMSAVLEVSTITNSRDICRRSLGADATHLGDGLANVTLPEDGFDLLVEVSNLVVELQKEGMECR